MGGGIYYNMNRPTMSSNSYTNNSANYGPNIASYAVRIVEKGSTDNKIYINETGSGLQYENTIELELVDYDNQVMVLENSEVAKISPTSANAEITSTDFAKFTKGGTIFDSLVLVSQPGLTDIKYQLTSKAINSQIISQVLVNSSTNYQTSLYVDFRFCKPGEIQTSNGK